MRNNLRYLTIATLFFIAALDLAAGENQIPEYDKHNVDKIARLTAKEHSTILFTLYDHVIGLAKDGNAQTTDSGGTRNCQYPYPSLSHDELQIAYVSNGRTEKICRILIYDIPTGARPLNCSTWNNSRKSEKRSGKWH
jgi:hypothetical protein